VVTGRQTRLLLADHDELTLQLMQHLLVGSNFEVWTSTNVEAAIAAVSDFNPHIVITDLDFGVAGLSGIDLLNYLDIEHPWVGKIVLTVHSSAKLAVPLGKCLPAGVTYLVKSEITTLHQITDAIENAFNTDYVAAHSACTKDRSDKILITSAQSEILMLMAKGLTNAAIAEHRCTSLRKTEALVQRTFAMLGLRNDRNVNPRVMAVWLWQQGKVLVK
jgi:DNA-binding NarL/FixJ family response regulator